MVNNNQARLSVRSWTFGASDWPQNQSRLRKQQKTKAGCCAESEGFCASDLPTRVAVDCGLDLSTHDASCILGRAYNDFADHPRSAV
ncbi:hypothetical protein N9L68_05080 [bacterium]|nr:hypothetical protein [bacterium]